MEIRDLKARPLDAARPQAAAGRGEKRVTAVDPSRTVDNNPVVRQRDRLSISETGRASLEKDISPHELAFAKKALMEIPPLAEERIAEIHQRIKEGYYLQQEVSRHVAQRIASESIGWLE